MLISSLLRLQSAIRATTLSSDYVGEGLIQQLKETPTEKAAEVAIPPALVSVSKEATSVDLYIPCTFVREDAGLHTDGGLFKRSGSWASTVCTQKP